MSWFTKPQCVWHELQHSFSRGCHHVNVAFSLNVCTPRRKTLTGILLPSARVVPCPFADIQDTLKHIRSYVMCVTDALTSDVRGGFDFANLTGLQMQDKTDRLIANTANPAVCDNGGAGCLRADSDILPSKASTQAGALTLHVPLSAALSLLNKQQHGSPSASNSERASNQQRLRPIVARFLESLPSIGKAGSFDADIDGLHGRQKDDDRSDSISCCSCNSLQRPASVASIRTKLWLSAPQLHSSRHHAAAAAGVDLNEDESSSTATPGALAGDEVWSSADGQLSGSATHKDALWQAASSKGAARHLDFATAESTGSAPTPSPMRGNVTDADHCRGNVCSANGQNPGNGSNFAVRRGVFVGNLPGDVNERALVELFSRCGRIDSLWIARNAGTQTSLGYGFVVFDAASGLHAAQRAEQLDGMSLQQHRICVRVSTRNF